MGRGEKMCKGSEKKETRGMVLGVKMACVASDLSHTAPPARAEKHI